MHLPREPLTPAALTLALLLQPGSRLVLSYGRAGADIGCSGGRDVARLADQGLAAVGYAASAAMLQAAREHYPEQAFHCDSLPDLPTIPDQAFANGLCSGVLMRLPRAHLPTAVLTLARILKPGGRLMDEPTICTMRERRCECDRPRRRG